MDLYGLNQAKLFTRPERNYCDIYTGIERYKKRDTGKQIRCFESSTSTKYFQVHVHDQLNSCNLLVEVVRMKGFAYVRKQHTNT